MRRRHNIAFFICLCLLVLVATTLAMAKYQKNQVSAEAQTNSNDLAVQFERLGCYGNCPAYKLTIYADGRIEYEGKKFVKQTGQAQGRITPADLTQLVAQFDKADFWTMDQYNEKSCTCTVCTDMPAGITEIHNKNKSHRVEHYYGCSCAPKALWDLEKMIDQIAHTEQWIGDVSKSGPFGTTCFNPKRTP